MLDVRFIVRGDQSRCLEGSLQAGHGRESLQPNQLCCTIELIISALANYHTHEQPCPHVPTPSTKDTDDHRPCPTHIERDTDAYNKQTNKQTYTHDAKSHASRARHRAQSMLARRGVTPPP